MGYTENTLNGEISIESVDISVNNNTVPRRLFIPALQ